jgi:hypothetical protein
MLTGPILMMSPVSMGPVRVGRLAILAWDRKVLEGRFGTILQLPIVHGHVFSGRSPELEQLCN